LPSPSEDFHRLLFLDEITERRLTAAIALPFPSTSSQEKNLKQKTSRSNQSEELCNNCLRSSFVSRIIIKLSTRGGRARRR
jgi:hypothetical protein